MKRSGFKHHHSSDLARRTRLRAKVAVEALAAILAGETSGGDVEWSDEDVDAAEGLLTLLIVRCQKDQQADLDLENSMQSEPEEI
jgi:hypothetical protein